MSGFYFASRYSRHAELRDYRDQIQKAIPHVAVTSRWIDCHNDTLEKSFTPEALNADPDGCWPYGLADLEDLRAADTLVSFTGPGGKGGRHIEHGYAMALGHRIVVVGPRENVFHTQPGTEVYATWSEFLAAESVRPTRYNAVPVVVELTSKAVTVFQGDVVVATAWPAPGDDNDAWFILRKGTRRRISGGRSGAFEILDGIRAELDLLERSLWNPVHGPIDPETWTVEVAPDEAVCQGCGTDLAGIRKAPTTVNRDQTGTTRHYVCYTCECYLEPDPDEE